MNIFHLSKLYKRVNQLSMNKKIFDTLKIIMRFCTRSGQTKNRPRALIEHQKVGKA